MKVLHVIPSLDSHYGGPVAALVGLTEAQKSAGLDVTVVATQKSDADISIVERLGKSGVSVRTISPASGPLLRHPQLATAVNEAISSVDIVHIHGLWEEIQFQAAYFAHLLQKPYIIRACGMLDPWSLEQSRLKKLIYMRWRLRKMLRCATALHFTSQTECDSMRSLNLNMPKIVESNGINLDEFESLPPSGTFRDKYLIGGETPIILFLGRIHPGKGLEYLIPAFAKAQTKQAVLVIVGPDSEGYRATIETMVEAHELRDRIFFTGILHGGDRIAALAEADLFALPSAHENFGIAIVEALAAGTPVIISDQVGIHDQITSAEVGVVVPLDIDVLANELTRWMSDDDLRQSAANRARAFVRARYDWRQIAERWADRYTQLIRSYQCL